MTDAELMAKVKLGLGVSGTYQDDTLKVYVDEVKGFMEDAGVPKEVIDSSQSVGVITRGVSDLWNYGNGAELSPYFMQRVAQLVYSGGD